MNPKDLQRQIEKITYIISKCRTCGESQRTSFITEECANCGNKADIIEMDIVEKMTKEEFKKRYPDSNLFNPKCMALRRRQQLESSNRDSYNLLPKE